jgi:hypothetical protein
MSKGNRAVKKVERRSWKRSLVLFLIGNRAVEKNERHSWRRSLVLFLVISIALISIWPIACVLSIVAQNFAPLSDVENFIGMKVPTTATDVHHSYRVYEGVSAHLRFDLPVIDIPGFVGEFQGKKACSPSTPEDNNNPFDARQEEGNWFRPSTSRVYAGQNCYADGIYYSLLIDKTNPTVNTIYLFAGDHCAFTC